MRIKDIITPSMCKSTQGGWIWYCDACDTHGNADSSDEAKYMAEAHDRYHSWLLTDEDDEVISYMDMSWKERDKKKYKWESECLSATYFINVDKNITYHAWDDLDNETPNEPVDLELAIELQKRMGLQ